LQDTINMVKRKMRLALDTGSQRVCCRVNRTAPYRLALVGLRGTGRCHRYCKFPQSLGPCPCAERGGKVHGGTGRVASACGSWRPGPIDLGSQQT
jgi:hypothetical protein